MTVSVPLDRWPRCLEAVLSECRIFRDVRVLAETASTQDVARAMVMEQGLIVVAWRQTGGRGRFERAWADTGEDGVAVTFVAPTASPERLTVASAVAVARTAEFFGVSSVGIKWPNDIVVERRKLAGILIERTGEAALIGIGLNVGQSAFDGELAESATSMRLLGILTDRCAVLEQLIRELDTAFVEDLESLARAYGQRDALRGTLATFGTPEGEVVGLVERVNPFEGLVLNVEGVERRLSPATTTVVSWVGRTSMRDAR